jgi:hypothetical protein
MMGGRGTASNDNPKGGTGVTTGSSGMGVAMGGDTGAAMGGGGPGGTMGGGAMGGYGGMMQQMMRGRGGMMGGKAISGGMAGMMGIGGGTPPRHPVQTTKIRPRFDCLVEKVYVEPGQHVKKGDPMTDLFSIELARAKNDFLSARMQKENDQRNLDVRRKLVESAAISSQIFLDTQNAASKSNLAYQTARDNLLLLGLSDDSIDRIDKEAGEQKARMTLRSPVDGIVSQLSIQSGELSDTKSVIVVIEANSRDAEKPSSAN